MATSNLLIYNSTALTATISLSSLVTSTTSASNCWQGNTIDFGTPRAELWLARLQGAWTTTVTAGGTLDLYMVWSSSTVTSTFPGGAAGGNVAYSGPSGVPAEALQQLEFIGSLVVCAATASTVVQAQNVGVAVARAQYGIPIVCMRTSTTLTSTSANHELKFIPIYPQQQ